MSNQQGNKNTKQGQPTNPQGQQKGTNPPQKPVDLKVLFNLFIVKAKLINGLYIPKDDKDYPTIQTDYKKPFIKIIEVFNNSYIPLGYCIVNAEIPNFKKVLKFNESEISQFFNSDKYDLDKNSNNWNIEISVKFNDNLKKYNELKNTKDLKITYLIKEIPGIYINQKNISESHLNFKKHCETSHPPKEILNIYSSFVEDLNNFISDEKNKLPVKDEANPNPEKKKEDNNDFKNIVDNLHKLIDKISLNVESIPAPYTILQNLHNKNINACDIKAINNIIQKIFSFKQDDTNKIKDLKFNYYNNIHFGVLVALLLYYKNYTGDVMKYKIYYDDRRDSPDKNTAVRSNLTHNTTIGRHEKIYDPTFKMQTFNISALIDLLKDTIEIIDDDELLNEYYTPNYSKTFKSYITLLQYNEEILKGKNPAEKSYFKDEIEENRKLYKNFQINYNTNTIKSNEFGFVITILLIYLENHNKLYNSKTDFIKDIQFFMNNGIKDYSCSTYLLNNATQGLNSFINTSGNAISTISGNAGALLSNVDINNYSRNFTNTMNIFANVLNDKSNNITVVVNDNEPVLDYEYKNTRFQINTQTNEDTNNTNKSDTTMPIFFNVKNIVVKNDDIDDNLNEYVIKHIFKDANAVISCIQDSAPQSQQNSSPLSQQNTKNDESNNLFENMFYALNTKIFFENSQNKKDTDIKSETITYLRNIISENIGNYELNEYLLNYKNAINNKDSHVLKNSINTFIDKNKSLFRSKQPTTKLNKYSELDANELLDNKDFYKLLNILKKYVTTDDYWGDKYTIQIFEKFFNIKIILFNLDYDKIDCNAKIIISNVGSFKDQDTKNITPVFEPDKMQYLFMSYYRNNQYNYIYNVIQFFSSNSKITPHDQMKEDLKYIYEYSEIPTTIRNYIISDCAQNTDTAYSHFFKKISSHNNNNTKSSGGVGPTPQLPPYGPFFKTLNYSQCDTFYEFLYKRITYRDSEEKSRAAEEARLNAEAARLVEQKKALILNIKNKAKQLIQEAKQIREKATTFTEHLEKLNNEGNLINTKYHDIMLKLQELWRKALIQNGEEKEHTEEAAKFMETTSRHVKTEKEHNEKAAKHMEDAAKHMKDAAKYKEDAAKYMEDAATFTTKDEIDIKMNTAELLIRNAEGRIENAKLSEQHANENINQAKLRKNAAEEAEKDAKINDAEVRKPAAEEAEKDAKTAEYKDIWKEISKKAAEKGETLTKDNAAKEAIIKEIAKNITQQGIADPNVDTTNLHNIMSEVIKKYNKGENISADDINKYEVIKAKDNGNCFYLSYLLALPTNKSYTNDQLENQVTDLKKTIINEITNNDVELLKAAYNADVLAERDRVETYNKTIKHGEEKIREDATPNFFIKDIDTAEELKDHILNTNYYADNFIIPKIQNLYNVQFIIFNNNLIDKSIQIFKKDNNYININYIMLNFDNNHFDLISYNDKRMFKFDELPREIKCLLKDKKPPLTPDVKNFTCNST
jgi:hypothetical protein